MERGVLGLVLVPPLSGLSKATSKIAYDVRSLTPQGVERSARMRMLRERQPRALGPGAVLLRSPRIGRVSEQAAASSEPQQSLTATTRERERPWLEEGAPDAIATTQ